MTVQIETQTKIDDLKSQFSGEILFPGETGYETARSGWNLSIQQHPAMIVMAQTPEDIVLAFQHAERTNNWVAVQATGHGTLRPANGAILVVTAQMDQVGVDPLTRIARIEAGAKWGAVLEEAQAHGLAPLLGSSPTVGAVGYTLGGGLGWLARKFGLAADSVVAFDVVTAAGERLRLSLEENPDLFWALRGGGGGFAIVTAMEIQLFPVTEVYGGTLMYPPDLAKEVFHHYRQWIQTLPKEMTTSIKIANFPPLEFLPEFLRGRSFVMVHGCYCGPADKGSALVQEWLDWEPPVDNSFRVMPFSEVASISQDPVEPMPAYHNGAWVRELSEDAIDTLIQFGLNVDGSSPLVITEVRHIAGAISKADPKQSAFGYRGAPLVLDIIATTPTPEVYQFAEGYTDQFKAALAPHLDQGLYVNFIHHKELLARTQEAFPRDTYQHLVDLKSKYDPKNLLRSGLNIPPA